MQEINEYVAQRQPEMLEELLTFLRIPSVSTLSDHDDDCLAAARWMADHLKQLECKVSLLGDGPHPVVWAEGPTVPDAPTVLVYGHYDVQPPDPIDLWDTPPFEPTVRDGSLFARGATDDKGQVFSIVKAFETLCRNGRPPVNVRFLIEGEEESGGHVLNELLEREPERVDADAVIVSDMPFHARGWPAVYTALRGMCYAEIRVETLKTDLHSGLYGGVAPNAHEALVHILSQLKSPNGRIRIPGLYDTVERPSRAERDAWKRLPFAEARFRREEVGAKALTGLSRYTVFERLWALPTFDIHGIVGGFVADGAKTVIPAVATAKVSLRLVPNQKTKAVARQLRAAVKAVAPAHAKVTVSVVHGADPVQVDIDAAPVQLMSQAFDEVLGRPAVAVRGGGSIPIVPVLGKRGAPVVLTGIGLPDDRLHAPNEKIGLDQLWTGVRVFTRFFEMMGEAGS